LPGGNSVRLIRRSTNETPAHLSLLLSATKSGLCARCSVQPVQDSVSVAQCNQISRALGPLLSAARSGPSLCLSAAHCSLIRTLCPLLIIATKSGLFVRCSLQPNQDSLSVAHCNQIRALCPLLIATKSGLRGCARCSVQPVHKNLSFPSAPWFGEDDLVRK
jgi:hypothetical protein